MAVYRSHLTRLILILISVPLVGCGPSFQITDDQKKSLSLSEQNKEDTLNVQASKRDASQTLYYGPHPGAATTSLKGATVSGKIYVQRKTGTHVTGVGFMLDNKYMGYDSAAPFDYPLDDGFLDTRKLSDGKHKIQFTEKDKNNDKIYNYMYFYVDNSSAMPNGSGLLGEYYDNENFTQLKFTRVDPKISFDFGRSSPDQKMDEDTFSIRWSGQIQAKYSERYKFHVTSDDGVRLYVNNQLIIDQFIKQAPTESIGEISLTKGQKYDIVLEYYEDNWGAMIQFEWSSASQEREIVPSNVLFPTDGSSAEPPPVADDNNEAPVPQKCKKFVAGHFVRVTSDGTRNQDGIKKLNNIFKNDLKYVKGVSYQFMWGDIETSKGVYNFKELDQVRDIVKSKGKKYFLKFQDRTFWTGCNKKFIPDYVDRQGPKPNGNPKFCTAKGWETETMNHIIRVLKAIAKRYHKEPAFLGFMLEETALAVDKKSTTYTPEKWINSLIRKNTEVNQAFPNIILSQGINWMRKSDHEKLANALVKLGNGGGLSWPDTVPKNKDKWHWYKTGREYNKKLYLNPSVQTPFIEPSETENIFKILVHEFEAHAVVWNDWHGKVKNYFATNVLPVINKNKGYIKNTKCPY